MLKSYFEPGTSLPNLLRAMHNIDIRKVWEKEDVEVLDLINVVDDRMIIVYQKSMSSVSFISAREFLEKKIIFRDGNAIYFFFSSIPDEFKISEDENTVRAYTITGF